MLYLSQCNLILCPVVNDIRRGVRKAAALAASESQPRRCSGQSLVRSLPFQANLRFGTGLPALKACGDNVLVQMSAQAGDALASRALCRAFFMESQPPARAIVIMIIDFEFCGTARLFARTPRLLREIGLITGENWT